MFNESKVWFEGAGADRAELESRIGPSIAISPRRPAKERPKQEYLPVNPSKHVGKVTGFVRDKGFGFIDGRLFFHVAELIDGNKAHVRKGATVAYEEGVDKRSSREKAVDVQLVKPTEN
ncbi:cold shock domain-containing protein [Paenibacillus sp. CAU 1782]